MKAFTALWPLLLLFLDTLVGIPIYWINLDDETDRKEAFEKHLQDLNLSGKRIPGLTPQTCNLLMIDNSCNSGTQPIAVLCSHVNVLYQAIHDPAAQSSPYFVVLEDDIEFLYHVDFDALIRLLPKNFASVQLMMSHKLDVETAWERYLSSLNSTAHPHRSAAPQYFTARERKATYWSAQAILYRKEAIAPFVAAAVKKDRQGRLGFKLLQSKDFDQHNPHQVNPFKPVIAAKCLHSDTFLYAMAQPSYVLNVPVLNSGALGLNSTLHSDHVPYHAHGFAAIEQITAMLSRRPELLPGFLRPLSRDVPNSKAMNWTHIAKAHPVSGKGIPKDFNI